MSKLRNSEEIYKKLWKDRTYSQENMIEILRPQLLNEKTPDK